MEERFKRIENNIMLKNIADSLRHLRVDDVPGSESSEPPPPPAPSAAPAPSKPTQSKRRQSSQQQAALLRSNLAGLAGLATAASGNKDNHRDSGSHSGNHSNRDSGSHSNRDSGNHSNRDSGNYEDVQTRLAQELISMGFRPEVAHYGAQYSKASRADEAAHFLIQQKSNQESNSNYRNLMSMYGSLDNIPAAQEGEEGWLSGASTSSETSTVPSRPASPALRTPASPALRQHRPQSPRIVMRSNSPRNEARSQAPRPMYSPYSANSNYLYGPSFSKAQPNKLTYVKYPQIQTRRDNTALLPPRTGPVMGCHYGHGFCTEQSPYDDNACYSDSEPVPYDTRHSEPLPYDSIMSKYSDIRDEDSSPCGPSPPPQYSSNPPSNRSSIGPNDLPPYEFAPINPPPCLEQTSEGNLSVSEAVKKINENIAQSNTIVSPKPIKEETPVKVSKSKKPPKRTGPSEKSKSDKPLNKIEKIFSPLPRRKNKLKEVDKIVPKLPAQSPTAVKFYLEQHIENLIKETESKKKRRDVFEEGIANCTAKEQQVARKKFSKEESNFLRLKRTKINKDMFNKIQTIGIGSFGEVSLVQKKDNGILYAMKTLRKVEVWKRNQTAHVKAERDILSEADNEWVVKLHFSFQDKDNLYFVMNYVPGGDMMSLLIKAGKFPEYVAKFYIAELICAVESVHKLKFVHRDIKPDNILIDAKGHLKLTDFGLCTGFRWTHESSRYHSNSAHDRQGSIDFDEEAWKKMKQKCQCGDRLNHSKPLDRRRAHQRCLAHSLVGTPNYIAPEVLLRQLYHFECDWWSVGVILYEMIIGRPPFLQPTPADTQLSIINWRSTLSIPRCAEISDQSIDLIFNLLQDAHSRLGIRGAEEIKSHPFFGDIDWDNQHDAEAPFLPDIKYPTDTQYFDTFDEERVRFSDIEDSEDNDLPDHPFYEFTFRRFDNGKPTEEQPKRDRGPVFV